jgi:soluble lytic murein transglycosylase-like protein
VVALRLLAASLALSAGPATQANPVDRWQPLVAEAALRCGIPGRWIARVMLTESGGNTTLGGRPIRSAKGAMGLMQLMPATWGEMQVRLGLGDNPDDPHDNIVAGACYLRMMYDLFGYPGLFGAYNAGPARYAAWIDGRQPLPGETIAYLAKLDGGHSVQAAKSAPARPALFAVRNAPPASSDESVADASSPPLFAIRKRDQ